MKFKTPEKRKYLQFLAIMTISLMLLSLSVSLSTLPAKAQVGTASNGTPSNVWLFCADNARDGTTAEIGPSTNHTAWVDTDLGDGYVYIVANDELFLMEETIGNATEEAFNATTGHHLWTTSLIPLGESYGATYYNGMLFLVGNQNVTLAGSANKPFALNALTGKLVWTYTDPIPAAGSGIPFKSPNAYGRNPIVYNGVLYETAVEPSIGNNTAIIALNPTTGTELWRVNTDLNETILNRVNEDQCALCAAGGGLVYFGIGDTWVVAVNPTTQSIAWTYQFGVVGHSVAGQGEEPLEVLTYDAQYGTLFAGGWQNTLDELNATTGAYIWSVVNPLTTPLSYPVGWQGSVCLGNSTLGNTDYYCGTVGTTVYCFNGAGGVLWSKSINFVGLGGLDGANKLYSGDGCYNAFTGAPIWQDTDIEITSGLSALANGYYYAEGTAGSIYCFAPPPISTLTCSVTPTTVSLGTPGDITGTMAMTNGTGIANEQVTVQYRTPPVYGSWITIGQPITASDGTYSVSFIPPTVGTYQIAADFAGTDYSTSYAGTNLTVTFPPMPSVNLAPISGSVSNLQSQVSTMQTYLIATVLLVVIAIVLSAIAVVYSRRKQT